MSDFDSLKKKAADFLSGWSAKRVKKGTKFSVKHDSFDTDDWASLRDQVPVINHNIRELQMSHDYVEPFMEDFFNLLHQGDPLFEDRDVMDDRYRPNLALSTEFKEMPEVESLRISTMHDPFATAMAMITMQPALKKAYERQTEAQQAAREAAEAREQQNQAAKALHQALADTQAADPNDPQAQQQAQQNLQAAVDAAEAAGLTFQQAQDQAQQQAEQAAAGARAGVRQAANQAANERQEEEQLMASFGVEPGELQRMSFEERAKLAERLRNNRLAKFAKLIGQFKQIQKSESRRKVVHSPDMVVGVEFGSDLQRVTAGELMNLAAPETEDDFWMRWANAQLVQYKLEGSEKLGQGPIIVVCDESSSMSYGGYGGATAEAWSKALSLALCDQARRGKRDFHYIGFASAPQQWIKSFPGGRTDLNGVIEFTEHFFSGGTHYETPLVMALELVEEAAREGKPKPDIVFITDDEYRVPNAEFLERWHLARKNISMHCYGIVIGRQSSGSMDAICDNVRSITTVTSDPSAVADVFRTI
jgi:uncharacterized protein with von Willebrand factor type A (vWA) domain